MVAGSSASEADSAEKLQITFKPMPKRPETTPPARRGECRAVRTVHFAQLQLLLPRGVCGCALR